jgi:hypothetical protein
LKRTEGERFFPTPSRTKHCDIPAPSKMKEIRIRSRIGMGMTPETSEWVSNLANWALVISLVVGVAATFFIVVAGNVKEAALKRSLAASQERIAELGMEAEALKAQAEADRLARIEIERKVADRGIDSSKVRDIIRRIGDYAPQPFEVNSLRHAQEPAHLAGRILQILELAQWTYLPPEKEWIPAGVITGVRLVVHWEALERTVEAANALESALEQVGVETRIMRENNPAQTDPNKIRIFVGVKP